MDKNSICKKVKLGKYAQIILGGTPSTKEPSYWNGHIPWATVVDFNVVKHVFETEKKITEKGLKESNTKLLNAGDIIISARGTVGEIVVCGNSMAFNQSCYALRSKSENLDQDFLYYLLSYYVDQLKKKATGGVFDTIVMDTLENLDIHLPKIKNQKIISFVLSCFDDLIENNYLRIQILEQIANIIYEKWFVKFKFPNHQDTQKIDSDLGKIPKGWEISRLGDKIKVTRGKIITKREINPGNVPVVAAGINPSYFHNQSNTNYPVVTISGSGANAGYIKLYLRDIWASDCSYIDRNTTEYIYYYYSLLKNKQLEITSMQRGSAQPHVYAKDIMDLKIVVPPEEIIGKFEKLLTPFFNEISNLKSKSKISIETRDLLLQKLFNREIDVSDLDINIPEEDA